MRKILVVIILSISIAASSQADDIKEFEIEGMSIGNSALDYFSEKKILEEFEIGKDEYNWTDQKFADVYKYGGMELYDKIVVSVKRKDKKYIIYSVTGQIDYENINDCFKKQKEIEDEFSSSLSNTKKKKWVQKHSQDKTGKSKLHWVLFEFNDGAKIEVICQDLAKHMKSPSGLDVGIVSAEFRNWLNSF